MAYEKERKRVAHFGPIRATGPEGTKGAYDYALKDHYIRIVNILDQVAFVRRCVKEGLKVTGDLDAETALTMIKQSENKKRVIRLILKHLNNEDLDVEKVVNNFKKYISSLEKQIQDINTTFMETDKFKAGAKVLNKQECLNSAEKAKELVKGFLNVLEYIDKYNKEQELGHTV